MNRRPPKLALLVVVLAAGALAVAGLFAGSEVPGSTTRPPLLPRISTPDLSGGGPTPRSAATPSAQPWSCPRCGRAVDPSQPVCPGCGWYPAIDVPGAGPPVNANAPWPPTLAEAGRGEPPALYPSEVSPQAAAPRGGAPDTGLSPREQQAWTKQFIEGHWLGLEVIPLTPELAKEYGIAPGDQGVLVDEITLESAESGILAGDMVHAVGGTPTPDLKQFFVATQQVARQATAPVQVSRRGTLVTFEMRARNAPELGFAQMEAAQPIVPGSISPHRTLSDPCTSCHIIMATGGQLPTDMGDILPTPPPITASAVRPHGNRGPCEACHLVVP